ncbi:hypothetical protein IFM89_005728 [Coptis chinensis]|uniref:Proline-rich protein n=1 Tax=Coptis chinensis TaxID=261450 RepID=A0A835IL32_9MAGN|nr:hypothetical protein IFM89_005728 [Coptis chinensis]
MWALLFSRRALFGFSFTLLLIAGFCYCDDKFVEVVGTTKCADCKENDLKNSQVFSGIRVVISCKDSDEKFKTRGVGELDEEGKFKVVLPSEITKDDGQLNEECYAQLQSEPKAACPTNNGLEASKIIFKSKDNRKLTLVPASELLYSSITCPSTSFAFFPKIKPLPFPKFKKPLPPPIPKFKKPLPPSLPKYKKPFPPPLPKYTKPLPPPFPKTPIFKKPFPPFPKVSPIYKKPFPPSPASSPLPTLSPIPKTPISKKPFPAFPKVFATYQKPFPRLPTLPPIAKPPLPAIPKFKPLPLPPFIFKKPFPKPNLPPFNALPPKSPFGG